MAKGFLICGLVALSSVAGAYTLGDEAARVIIGGDSTIVSADLETGDRTVISGTQWGTGSSEGTVGTGDDMLTIIALVAEDADHLLAINTLGDIFRVDRTTGDRTKIYDPLFPLPILQAVPEDSDHLLLALASGFVVRHTISTGEQGLVTSGVGTTCTGMALAPGGDLFLLNATSFLSVDTSSTNSLTTLPSPPFTSYTDLALFPNGDLVSVSWDKGVATIDSTGTTWTTISDSETGSGDTLIFPSAAAVSSGNWVYVFDATEGAVVRVNPNTGDRVVLSRRKTSGFAPEVGDGFAFQGYYGGSGSPAMLLEGTITSDVEDWHIY